MPAKPESFSSGGNDDPAKSVLVLPSLPSIRWSDEDLLSDGLQVSRVEVPVVALYLRCFTWKISSLWRISVPKNIPLSIYRALFLSSERAVADLYHFLDVYFKTTHAFALMINWNETLSKIKRLSRHELRMHVGHGDLACISIVLSLGYHTCRSKSFWWQESRFVTLYIACRSPLSRVVPLLWCWY